MKKAGVEQVLVFFEDQINLFDKEYIAEIVIDNKKNITHICEFVVTEFLPDTEYYDNIEGFILG